jgi:hypothetical protein
VADFRAFLGPKEPVVLPYLGGTRVDSAERRLRVDGELERGWWRFRVEGRRAVPIEPALPPSLDGLPKVAGHWVLGWIASDGRSLARVALMPDDEPAPLARVTGRRWHSGDVLFESIDFEDDAELAARRALENQQPLGELRGVVPSLRVAFGLALGGAIAKADGIAVSVRELVPAAVAIADRGREAVREHLAGLVERRRVAEDDARRAAEQIRLTSAAGTARAVRRHDDPVQRADDALDGADARMLRCRRIDRGLRLDVAYEVDGTRIRSIVDAETLQVLDPGICLSGQHEVLTLDAMPSVVREAIANDALNITRPE